MTISYIAVHGGAGFHGTKYEKEIKQALRRACLAGLSTVTNTIVHADGGHGPDSPSSSSLSIVEDAICVLEDEQHLNAGYGSNLTTDGTVECDASIMAAQGGYFGSVGAVSGIKNPIRLAKAILENSRIPNKFERVPPLALVSGGAHTFAMNAGNIEVVPPDALVSPTARATWEKWKARMDAPDDVATAMEENDPEESLLNIQDTVGAVAFHPESGLAAGVSSGGLLMKYPGRVGEAAIFGAGCWADQSQTSSGIEGIACSISGTGEYIIRENLAAKLGNALRPKTTGDGKQEQKDPHEALNEVLNNFWHSFRERGVEEPAVGVLLLVSDGETPVRLWCGFTTASMAVGFASSESAKPKALILRPPNFKARTSKKPQIYITSMALTQGAGLASLRPHGTEYLSIDRSFSSQK